MKGRCRKDRITIERDGERLDVFNWVNITQKSVIYAGAGSTERFTMEIGAGDSSIKPERITEWIAKELWHEYGFDAEENGIEVVDVESDEVTVL